MLVGQTRSINFPVTPGALDKTLGNGIFSVYDAFVTRIGMDGTIWYSTYLGGTEVECPFAIALDSTGAATAGGGTLSCDFPVTPGAYDTTSPFTGVGYQAFVSRLDLLPTGVRKFGESTPGCAGPLPVTVNSMPSLGNYAFTVACAHAPPQGFGYLGISEGGLSSAATVLGASFWIDPRSLFLLPVQSDPFGVCALNLPLVPVIPPGFKRYLQFFFSDACAPGRVSASHALEVTVQP